MKSPIITKKIGSSTWVAYFLKDKSKSATGSTQLEAFKKLINK